MSDLLRIAKNRLARQDKLKLSQAIDDCESELSRVTDRLIERDKEIAKLRAALIENGKAFGEYGDHVRQAGCYSIAALEE